MTVSIIGGYITLLILLSPLCAPKPSLARALPGVLAEQLSSAAHSAGGNMQTLSRQIRQLASDASSSLFSSLHTPLVPVRSGSSWFSGGGGSSIDTKRLLHALKVKDTATLAKQLNIPIKRVGEFTKSLEKGLQGVNFETLQAGLVTAADAGSSAWMKKGIWGWARALLGSGSTLLL